MHSDPNYSSEIPQNADNGMLLVFKKKTDIDSKLNGQ